MEMRMNFDKGFYDGKMSDYRKRQFDREEKERLDNRLGLAYMDREKKLVVDEISRADEEYLGLVQ